LCIRDWRLELDGVNRAGNRASELARHGHHLAIWEVAVASRARSDSAKLSF
jgi:hypothetical protein